MQSLLALVLSSLPAASGPACAQQARTPDVQGFRFAPERLHAGRVWRYRKSNLDGSNPSEVALYLAEPERLESLKWHADEDVATLVVAEMDWETFSVSRFRTYRVEADGTRTLRFRMDTAPDRSRLTAEVEGRELECPLGFFPWHSYDFDLASLNLALRFLTEPEGEVELSIVDPDQGAGGPALRDKGRVFLSYEGAETRSGQACRRYTLDGPGLEDRGGRLWAASGEEVFLVAFEIDLPDEPGMASGRLEWQRSLELAPAEWERFVRERLDGAAR